MGSRDEADPLRRFLYDDDSDRTFARLHSGAAPTPRRPRLADLEALQLWGDIGASSYTPSEYLAYTTSSAGARISGIHAHDDVDSSYTPAEFMRPSARHGTSHPAGSSGRSKNADSYRTPSRYSSNVSSVAPSFFTHASARTSAGASSLPPTQAHITNFNQTLAASAAADYAPVGQDPPIAPAAGSHLLWCELCVLGDCPVAFRIDQTNEWIDHHCHHLKDQYPRWLVCWFCDDFAFNAAGRSGGDRRANFLDRMEHIREHIAGDYLTMDHMRPDFRMINHLADMGVIENAVRDLALAYSEVPDALRMPGGGAGGVTQPYQPHRRQPGPGLAHDLDRQRRHQRPRGGRRHHSAATHDR